MKQVIAYSLWGSDPKYTIGALRNAQQLEEFYPSWIAKFYVDITTPRGIVYELESYNNVQVAERYEVGDWRAMFWRFEATFDDDADVVLFRDTDCRLNSREKAAVDEWLESDKTFHIMRDHPYHKFPILGGMWGAKKNDKYDMKRLISDYYTNHSADRYGTDYEFFIQILYPLIKDDCMEHDEFFNGKPFPIPRNWNSTNTVYVGEPYDGNDELCFPEHRETLRRSLHETR